MNSRFLFLLTLLSLAGSGFAQDAGPLPLISVSGASAALEANIQALLSIDDERCGADLFRLESRRSQVRREVDRAAQGLGFYRLSQQLRFGRSDACWTLQIDVVPGEPVLFGDIAVRFAGAQPGESAPFEALLASSPVVSGAPLNHRTYENLKSALSALAVESGYFSARFSRSELAFSQPEIAVEESDKEFRVVITLAEGSDMELSTALEDSTLSISAEIRTSMQDTRGGLQTSSTSVSQFSRAIELGEPVDAKGMKTERSEGEIVITVPKVG